MPLTAKGKKLKAKFRDQYGKKKGDSVFYAMENSGKLTKVIKARGGKDAADFGKSTSNNDPDNNREQYGARGQYTGRGNKGVGGNGTKKVTVARRKVLNNFIFKYIIIHKIIFLKKIKKGCIKIINWVLTNLKSIYYKN